MINKNYKDEVEHALNLINKKDFEKSSLVIEQLVKKFPNDFFLENLYGTLLLNTKKYDEAENYFRLSIKNNKKFSSSYFNLGLLLYENKQYKEAINNFLLAINLDKEHYQATLYLALSYENLKLIDDAINYFLKLLQFNEKNIEILYKITKCYLIKSDFKNATLYLNKCLILSPENFEYLYSMGWVCAKVKDFSNALEYYEKALKIKQTQEVYHGIAGIYLENRLSDLALENYKKCLIINPSYLPAINNIAAIKMSKKSYFEAVQYLEKYLYFKSDSLDVLANMGQAQFAILNFDKGLEYFEKSINQSASEKNYQKYLFSTLYLEKFEKNKYLQLSSKFSEIVNKKKINTYKIDVKNNNLIIGFVSGDFREHAVSYQITGLIRELKKFSDIKLFAYYNNNYEDNKTILLKNYFHKFENIFDINDDLLIQKIIEDRVNILIDLSGYSSLNRLSAFTAKPAPIQISAFGFLQTTGLKEIDYILADENVILNEDGFTEKILKIKEIWSTLDTDNISFEIGELPFSKNKYVTFGAFNNFNKLNEKTFKLWSEILKNVPNSKILFNNYTYANLEVRNFLYSEFEKNNVNKTKIIIENGGNREKVLKDYNKIDIILDTYPYGGHTTSLEAAWMCVPILTISGNSFVSRAATSLNQSLGLLDWNCKDDIEYLAKAIKFSASVDSLKKIKSELIIKRENSKIFDNIFYAKNFYSLMRNIWNKYLETNIK
jgi:predicted O-linked N-acetylglucosamine transferase (SPINDLY family)/lipopolysaccharide biosynthesis regulator YciM